MSDEYAKGEVVTISSTQKNAAGEVISELSVSWFGMENVQANMMTQDLVKKTLEAVGGWDAAKQQGKL